MFANGVCQAFKRNPFRTEITREYITLPVLRYLSNAIQRTKYNCKLLETFQAVEKLSQ